MGWKNWPAWVKGGVIGILLGTIIEILLFIVTNYCLDNSTGGDWFGLLVCYYIFLFPGFLLTNQILSAIIINILLVTVLSALIGLIIGKLKSKKRKNAI